jgi:hypothetical protein
MDYDIPDSNVDKFMMMVRTMTKPCGIDKIPELMEAVEFLSDAVDRHMTNKDKAKKQGKSVIHNDRKVFIAIFKRRYLELFDLSYDRLITHVDGKNIAAANTLLKKHGFSCDDYLKWYFETFLTENEKFAPGNINQCCSQTFLHKFITLNKEERDTRRKKKFAENESNALLNRARKLIRETDDVDVLKKLRDAIQSFKANDIMLTEFRKIVNEIEGTEG